MLKLEIKDLKFFFRFFPEFFSKYENRYGPYLRYAFRKNTKILKNAKIKKFQNHISGYILLSARHYGINGNLSVELAV